MIGQSFHIIIVELTDINGPLKSAAELFLPP